MKRTIASLALLLFASLAFGQPPTGPQLGTYGNLVGLRDKYGKDVLGQIPRPLLEGYAIAYRVKNSSGLPEQRLVYAIGDRLSSKLFRVEKKKSTDSTKVIITEDKTLEISRSFTWDEKSRSLKTQMTITNVGNSELSITGIEFQIDARVLAQSNLAAIPVPNPLCPTNNPCDECPGCVCGDRCYPPEAKALYRQPNISRLAFENDPFGELLPSFDCTRLTVFWAESSIERPTLKPGDHISVSATIPLTGNSLPG